MADIVFILGAGASAHTGAPLMRGFFSEAERLVRIRALRADDLSPVENTLDLIRGLQLLHSRSAIDLDNIEEVYTMIETAGLFGASPLESGSIDADEASTQLRWLIARVLELLVSFKKEHGSQLRIKPNSDYDFFARMVKSLIESERHRKSVAILTFNYDIALDRALWGQDVSFDYGLSKDINGPFVPFLKLHGSVGFCSCEECGVGYVDVRQAIPRNHPLAEGRIALEATQSWGRGHLTSSGSTCKGNVKEPFIVPPTWNKYREFGRIQPVWERALEEMKSAREIYVLGYSMPSTDSWFRNFYALSGVGAELIRNFWVFDLYPSSALVQRYKGMLGAGALRGFACYEADFGYASKLLSEHLLNDASMPLDRRRDNEVA